MSKHIYKYIQIYEYIMYLKNLITFILFNRELYNFSENVYDLIFLAVEEILFLLWYHCCLCTVSVEDLSLTWINFMKLWTHVKCVCSKLIENLSNMKLLGPQSDWDKFILKAANIFMLWWKFLEFILWCSVLQNIDPNFAKQWSSLVC